MAGLAGVGAERSSRRAYAIVGDAIPAPLTRRARRRGARPRDRRRTGRRACACCATPGPFPEERFQGTLAPDLAGAGTRWSAGQLRLRVVDSRRLNPATIMPSYHRIDDLARVGAAWRGRPVLDAQQVEDVVALLQTLRD